MLKYGEPVILITDVNIEDDIETNILIKFMKLISNDWTELKIVRISN